MLNFKFSKNILNENLKEDFKHLDDGTLYIIDSYNIKDLSDEIINFYIDAFKNTNIRRIEFYYEAKEISLMPINKIRTLSNELNIDFDLLCSFLGYLFNSFNIKEKDFDSKIRGKYKRKGNPYDPLKNAIKLIRGLISKDNIEVVFKAYVMPKDDYHIHGRYWVGYEKHNLLGYIVDGSLNTVENNVVLAQLMNDINCNIIANIFENKIQKSSKKFKQLNLENIENINETLKNFFQN